MTAQPTNVSPKLVSEILKLSNAKDWPSARQEWRLLCIKIEKSGHRRDCLCGHPHILNVCVLKHYQSNKTVEVGSVCVQQFIGIPVDEIFDGFNKITKNPNCTLKGKALTYTIEHGWLNEREQDFVRKIAGIERRWKLSTKQQQWRRQINEKILSFLQRKG